MKHLASYQTVIPTKVGIQSIYKTKAAAQKKSYKAPKYYETPSKPPSRHIHEGGYPIYIKPIRLKLQYINTYLFSVLRPSLFASSRASLGSSIERLFLTISRQSLNGPSIFCQKER